MQYGERCLYVRIREGNLLVLTTDCRSLWIEVFIRQCNFLGVKEIFFACEQKAGHPPIYCALTGEFD